MMNLVKPLFMAAIVAVSAFALVATGFGHRLPSSDDESFQAFVLAGGDAGDLCADTGDMGAGNHRDCPACHLTGAVDLPATAVTVFAANLVFIAKVVAPRESRVARTVLDPARGLRAPPVA